MNSFKQTFQLSWLLSILAAAIALFVFVNMIAIIMKDRLSDLYQVYVMGATYKQLHALISVQAIFLAIMSILTATVFGISFVYILLDQLTPVYFGWSIPVQLDWEPIRRIAVLIVILVLITVRIFTKLVWNSIQKGDSLDEATKVYYFSR